MKSITINSIVVSALIAGVLAFDSNQANGGVLEAQPDGSGGAQFHFDGEEILAAAERGELLEELPTGYEKIGEVGPNAADSFAKSAQDSGVSPEEFQESEKAFNFNVIYEISELPDVGERDVANFVNEETYTFKYHITSQEEEPINVVGTGGSFRNAATRELVANVSADAIGPLKVVKGESKSYERKYTMDLPDDNYVFVPELYVVIKNEIRLASLRPQLITVTTKQISLFDPQFLVLVLILTGIFALGGYLLYITFGKSYFNSTAPIFKNDIQNRKLKKLRAPSVTGVNKEWLPEAHLQKNRSRTKKTS